MGDVYELIGDDNVEELDEAIRILEEADLQANFEEEFIPELELTPRDSRTRWKLTATQNM